jgi:hypothetical protein
MRGVNTTCADLCTFVLIIRMKTNYAHPAVQICADVHFSVLIRMGVRYYLAYCASEGQTHFYWAWGSIIWGVYAPHGGKPHSGVEASEELSVVIHEVAIIRYIFD